MLTLGLESSAKAASAALCRDGELVAMSCQRSGLTHSRTLLPMVEDLLKNTDTKKTDIDAVAVANGPGSFTGIRIGVATAKGLCWGLDKPAVGVSTLEAMAFLAPPLGEDTVICPVMDARRGQVYNALFAWEGETLVRLHPDRALSAEALGAELAEMGRPVWVLGDGWKVCAEALDALGVAHTVAPELLRWQNAWGVCLAARGKPLAGAEELLPVYLRLSQAERERQERLARENQ